MGRDQLETVLRVRRQQRDQVRMALAQFLSEARAVEERRRQAEQERIDTLTSLRSATMSGPLDVDRAAAFRVHAARLSIDIAKQAAESALRDEHVRAAQAMLAKADQAVKAVEKLIERNAAEERRIAERRADREATDRFSATLARTNGVE
jgi:flagellar export protein FliJ